MKPRKPANRRQLVSDRLSGAREITELSHKKTEDRKPGGLSTATVTCPFCQRQATTLMRTLAASGKRCECTALHTGSGYTFRWADPNSAEVGDVLRAYVWANFRQQGVLSPYTVIAIATCLADAKKEICGDGQVPPKSWGPLTVLELDNVRTVYIKHKF